MAEANCYVPQSVFSPMERLRDNIAFGEKGENLDISNIRIAAKKLVCRNSFPDASVFDTPAGERGVQLSGGQRQRIGIARAIYKNKNLCF